ncbi:heme peroxidase family protein [Pararoseomonas sp. SCSIO 73927]|uniref:peroxidase family protein n=1 Tax=Pararoseomonas sp. SCSIO 73927 TaxID=3114537 RepID=UPI0030CF08AC
MTHHGELYLRDFVPPRSVYHGSGRFGRLFPDLAPFASPSEELRKNLLKLGAKDGPMDPKDPLIPPADALASAPGNADNTLNPMMTVGFTFLGQFLDHDITFDPTSSFERQQDPESVSNFRTPCFELDSAYGAGIGASPHLYDKGNKARFLIEKLGPAPDAKDDLPRNSQGAAIIGDPRNDENVILSQMHLAFLKFHNAVEADIRPRFPGTGERFAEAQRRVRWHYQWIILNQYLPATVGDDLVEDILENGRRYYNWREEPFIPAEFSVAAYRFGHSQIRPGYKPNPDLQAAIFDARFGQVVDGQVVTDLRGGLREPNRFVNWNIFFDFGDGSVKRNKLIDTTISTPLFTLPFDAPGNPTAEEPPATLAGRNLLRHLTFSLPCGQDVARAMGEEPLAKGDFAPAVQALKMAERTPLWFYILQEAKTREAGKRLGPVGGRIVAEVFIGLLQGDRKSYLRQHPKWRPEYASHGVFEMQELLHMAGMPGTRARP